MRRSLTVALLGVLLTPAVLDAHAHLTRSSPSANDRLDRSPDRLSLWFSERPELRFTSIQLHDSSDAAITIGAVAKIEGDPSGVVVPIPMALTAGPYTVIWRTAASDGHPSSGKFTFSVLGDTTRPVARSVDTIPLRQKPNQIVAPPVAPQPLNAAENWATLVAVLTVIGAIVFRGAVIGRASWDRSVLSDASDRARRLAQGALGLALVASLTRLAAEASLMPESQIGMRTMWEVARDTSWGHGWLLGAVGIIVAALGLTAARRVTAGWMVAALGAVALTLSQSLTGHAGADAERLTLSISANTIHLLAAGAWIGGLISVVLAGLPAVGRQEEPAGRAGGSSMVRAYHDVAFPSVILIALTGLANTWLRVHGFSALWSSAYGRVLVAKIALFLMLLLFGYYHWRTAVAPNWDQTSASRFRRTALLELLVGALVLIATAALVSMATPEIAAHAH
jgi:putative copper export protein/methionine-rich copper-binding protein CopC